MRSGTILSCLSRTVASTLTVFTSTAILYCAWPRRSLPRRAGGRITAARMGFRQRGAPGTGRLPNLSVILLLGMPLRLPPFIDRTAGLIRSAIGRSLVEFGLLRDASAPPRAALARLCD